tara:strand:+ start:13757 stop:14032 length:276 start_codon:yes stop_codon:yes gene_type:complete
MTEAEKSILKHEELKNELRSFLIKLNSLLNAKVAIYNSHSGQKERLEKVSPKDFSYQLSISGEKCLKQKRWDEIDYMRFRNSFKYRDGFTV